MANSTLQAIRDKVRKLTRTPSTFQMDDPALDEYINTFILYDFPENLKLFSLRTTLVFYTQPNVDLYQTSTVALNPLYNFKNRYVAVHPPVFFAGISGYLFKDRAGFYNTWPQTNFIYDTTLRGSGAAGPYAGNIQTSSSTPFLQNNVIFTANDANGTAMILKDSPLTNTTGNLIVPGTVPPVALDPANNINYLTGIFTITFPNAVPLNGVINSETVPYQPGKPIAMLFYDNKFTVRPVPDKAYKIEIEVDARPTELMLGTDLPDESQWWQYVAYGAAIKVFQDRMDPDSESIIRPEFMHQQNLVARKTVTQACDDRASTVYTSSNKFGAGWFMSSWPY
jgi:hypothetical protein